MMPRGKDRASSLPLVKGVGVAGWLMVLLSGVAAGGDNVRVEQPKRVLIVESYGRDIAPWNAITPAFKNELARQLQAPVEFHDAALESARDAESQSEFAFTEYLRALYVKHPPDVVVPVGAAATQFWWRHRPSLFPSVPVVIGGIEDRILQTLPLGANDTAVTVQIDIARTGFEIIFEVFPAATNIAVVIGDSRLERFWNAECQRAWIPFSHRGQLVSFNTLTFPEIGRRAATLPPGSVLTYWVFWVDAAGVPHEQMRALDHICAVANAPVFGLFEEQLGHGIVGGRLISSDSIGREAASLAARVLGGEPAGKIPPVVLAPGPPLFDWRQLQRWNIDERQLPPDSVVRFRQSSVWQRYRWFILGALGIMIAQAATILGLVLQRARRRRAEATAYELAGRLITAQEEEHRRMAGELHDGLSQDLLVIASEAQLSLGQPENPPATVTRLKEIAETARQAIQQARRMAHNLRPGLIEELGFTKAVRASANKTAHAAGLSIDVALADVDGLLPSEFEVNLFRIIQETLNNVLKHASASQVKVTLTKERAHLRLVVEDNGCGFDPSRLESLAPDQRGLGLREIAERVKMMRGRVVIQSRPGQGTQVTLEIPTTSGKNGS